MRQKAIVLILIFMVAICIVYCCNFTLEPQLRITPPLGPAEFEVSALEFTLASGELIKLEARIRNIGGVGGNHTAILKVNGETMNTIDVTLAAGDTEVVSFVYYGAVKDIHTVEVDGFRVSLDSLINVPNLGATYVVTVRNIGIPNKGSRLPKTINLLPLKLDSSYISSAAISRNYTWAFAGSRCTWEIQVPDSLYSYFKGLLRTPVKGSSFYINNSIDDTFIELIVVEIERVSQDLGLDDLGKLEFVIAFVQGLPYTVDSVTTPYDDYPRYPIETLVDMGGDCEDTSILLASLLDKMGYKVVLVYFPRLVTDHPHYGVGILGQEDTYGTYWEHGGEKYFYLETTNTGWGIGQIPEGRLDIPAIIYDVN